MNMLSYLRLKFVLGLFMCHFAIYAQEEALPAGYDFFASDEVLHLTLGFEVRNFIKNKSEPENFNAILTIYDRSDTIMKFLKVKARGEMRRKYCTFPPLTMKFKKAPNLKLVTHCRNSEQHQDYLFREYLAYKLYNQVTPYSFKTRLVQIDYIDIKTPGRIISAYGFLIENDDMMASRNKSMVLNNDNISQRHMNSRDMARVAIFNYMMGNTDWSVLTQHNIKILRKIEELTDEGIPVAYDFDYSGFVSTAYSAPAEDLPIKTVSERYYQGNCINSEQIVPVIEEFEELKPEFLQTINNFDLLPENSRKKLDYYINGFYRSFKNPDILVSELNRTCKSTEP
jgi:hypothetical protein